MKKVLVETSARHVHVNEETFLKLFGNDAELEVKKMLSQPTQFASQQKVTLVGPKNSIERVSILGPFRGKNQVEVSATDARTLGIKTEVRESGHIDGTPGLKLVGPKGEVDLKEGLIIAKRHIHATPEDATELGVKNGQIVKVKIEGGQRQIIFDDVVVRVSPRFKFAMHIDTDEANACFGGIPEGEIIK
ncbi:MAG: phosphate propanoyltransferase [Bacilli bacterium]